MPLELIEKRAACWANALGAGEVIAGPFNDWGRKPARGNPTDSPVILKDQAAQPFPEPGCGARIRRLLPG